MSLRLPAFPAPPASVHWFAVGAVAVLAAFALSRRAEILALPDESSVTAPRAGATTAAMAIAEARSTAAMERSVAVRTDTDAPATVAPEFELAVQGHDELGVSQLVHAVCFGPADGWASEYEQPASGTFRWRAAARSADFVVDTGLLRRIRLEAGRLGTFELGRVDRLPTRRCQPSDFGSGPLSRCNFVEDVVAGSGGYWYALDCRCAHGQVRLRGRIVDAAGTGVAGAAIVIGDAMDVERAAPDGSFTLVCSRGTMMTLAVHAGARGTAMAAVPTGTDQDGMELRLQPVPTLGGRVVDRDGEPVANARVLWQGDAGAWNDHALTASDGTFAVPAGGDASGTLSICTPGCDHALPIARQRATPGSPAWFTVDRARCAGALRVVVAAPDGIDPARIAGRIWQRASGLGRVLESAEAEGCAVLTCEGLPAGAYDLELFCIGLGLAPAGSFVSDGQQRTDLRAALPLSTRVTFVPPHLELRNDEFALARCMPSGDRALRRYVGPEGPHLLGPGEYRVCWRDRDGSARRLPFSVRGGGGSLRIALH